MTVHNIYTLDKVTPTMISPPGTHSGIDITIQSINDSGYIYVGNSNVSETSFGYRISPGHAMSFELPSRDQIYLVSSVSGMKVAVLQIGLEGNN